MERLDENWLTNGLIDFEYKKYILLSYLKTVRSSFNDKKLFPHMSDLLFHYQNLKMVRDKKEILIKDFPKEISKADFLNMKIQYKKLIHDDQIIAELDAIIDYSTSEMKAGLDEGKEVYEYLEKNIEICPIGLVPLNHSEGYVFISEKRNTTYNLYRYIITIFENSLDKFRAINFSFIGTFTKMVSVTYESLKRELISKHKELPNPATYLIQSEFSIPYEETYIPMAKRMLVKYVYSPS